VPSLRANRCACPLPRSQGFEIRPDNRLVNAVIALTIRRT
jgi:hypothetical protein